MQPTLGNMFVLLWFVGILYLGVFWPFLICYAVWRHLHYLRHIAAALEVSHQPSYPTLPAPLPERTAAPSAPTGAISLSAFGR